MVGIVGLVVNEGSLYVLTDKLGMVYFISVLFSYQLSLISNFMLHSKFTFKDVKLNSYFKAFCRYELSIPLVFMTNYVVLISLVEMVRVNYLVANFIGICVAFVIHYTLSKKIVWSSHENKI